MNVSINPTYYCNFRCHFCYLTTEQLSDIKKINLETLNQKLFEIKKFEKIEHVDLYGGEIGLLPKNYLNSLIDLLKIHNINSININTNLSVVNDFFNRDDVYISVSYDFSVREQSEKVWNNMLKLSKPFSVLMLASDKLMKQNVDDMINHFNLIKNLESVEIKPYSKNQSNSYNVRHTDFEIFIQKWIDSCVEKKFEFVNESKIKDCLEGNYNAFSDDHVYITPLGNFAVLEFDLNDNEYFLELNTFEDYLKWTEKEKNSLSEICQKCKYRGKCLTEHYRNVKDLNNSCNGYINLLNNYEKRMEN